MRGSPYLRRSPSHLRGGGRIRKLPDITSLEDAKNFNIHNPGRNTNMTSITDQITIILVITSRKIARA